jgi:hypothetical protein
MSGVPGRARGEESKAFIPDKALCAKMLRFGKEAYVRGRYLDAKSYFRQAVQADPGSAVAWKYYDQAVIFALAEKVEQKEDLILPGVSKRGEMSAQEASTPPPPPPVQAAPKKEEPGFVIVDDEGC